MNDEKKPLVRLDIGSPISFKAEVKAEISQESSSRLLDALTDIIRPFSESRGLKADQIRLQREDVLIKIAKLTRERLEVSGAKPKVVPLKFLVPFLEKASQEEIDSELIGKWSHLLHSAATDYNSSMIRFTSVLSEIGPREVRFLDRLCRCDRTGRGTYYLSDAPDHFFEHAVTTYLNEIIIELDMLAVSAEEAFLKIVSEFENPGAILTIIWTNFEGHDQLVHPEFPINDDQDTVACSILESLGIVRQSIITASRGESVLVAHCLALTQLGLDFVLACDADLKLAQELKSALGR